jgi:uncharacterized protein
VIAYAELRAGLAKAQRMERITLVEFSELVNDVDEDWLTLSLIDLDMPAIRRAGALAERFGLRGYDSVHLAAAERVSAHVPKAAFSFAVFDDNVAEGARALGINVLA